VTVFVDTSALVAVLNSADPDHDRIAAEWATIIGTGRRLRTHNYIVVETAAVIQRRHGMAPARTLHDDIVPALSIRYVDESLHQRAVTASLAAGRRSVSLVDWTSFEMMRAERIADALAIDDDFASEGFNLVPGGGPPVPD
jgi:uncharacterized protein